MLEDGMKVIAVAYKTMSRAALVPEEEHDFILLGYLAFFDAPKKSAASAIQKLHSLHVNVKVLTGDQKQVARSICRRIGIPAESCLTGAQLDALSENELPIAVEKTNIFAELSPKQKAMLVETLQTNGHTVGFLGDGLNDLPAVIRADECNRSGAGECECHPAEKGSECAGRRCFRGKRSICQYAQIH